MTGVWSRVWSVECGMSGMGEGEDGWMRGHETI